MFDQQQFGIYTPSGLQSTLDNSFVFTNGAIWNCWLDYSGGSKTLSVSLNSKPNRPSSPQVSAVVDVHAVLGTTNMYLGLVGGGGAGGYSMVQVAAWSFSLNSQPKFQLSWSLTTPLASQTFLTYGNPTVTTTSSGTIIKMTDSNTGGQTNLFYNLPFAYHQNGVSLSFSAFFTMSVTCGSTCGDGMTFIITSQTAQGSYGEYLGYGSNFPHSIAVEFDTTSNEDSVVTDPVGVHIGIDMNGNLNSVVTQLINFATGSLWYVWVDYIGAGTQLLEVRLSQSFLRPSSHNLQYHVDLYAALGNSPSLYLGFGASTGANKETAIISYWQFSILSVSDLSPGLLGKYYNLANPVTLFFLLSLSLSLFLLTPLAL